MDRGGHDIPNQSPETPLRLRQIGVKRAAIPVTLADPFGGEGLVQLSCAVEASVGLEMSRRGIHVSRIGDLLARLSGKHYPSLLEYAIELNQGMCHAQGSDTASVSVSGVFTYLENISGVKEKTSLEHLDLAARVTSEDGKMLRCSGLGFSHITACPCVQETYRNSFLKDRDSSARNRGEKQIPLITHTQRCRTVIRITDAVKIPALPELLSSIDAVVVRNQNTLPREFELLNVHRAHAQPQFLEDVLRDLMLAIYRLVRPHSPEGVIQIRSDSMESIHDFNMEGEIEFSMKELDRIFAKWPSRNGHHSANGAALGNSQSIQKAGRKKPGRPSQIKRSPQLDATRR
jgi:GTP cyclohydrolase-4